MTLTKFNTLAFALLLAAKASANSLDNIANISFTEGNQLKHLEFSITDKGILTHGNGGRKVETQKDRFGDQPQLPDGRILLKPTGDGDAHAWDYNASRPGKYWMELVYSSGQGRKHGTAKRQFIPYRDQAQGHRCTNRFRNVNLGKIYFTNAGNQKIELKFKGDTPIVRAVILRPAPEGEPIGQALDRSILLHSRDATIHGVKVQYENKPHKNTVGFWVNTSDQVYWDFSVESGGKFDIEIHQGCGRGHGGSQVALVVADQTNEFIVEDTGHFQNFVPRKVGTVNLAKGDHRFWIKPIKKARGAVMDVRRIRLIPVD